MVIIYKEKSKVENLLLGDKSREKSSNELMYRVIALKHFTPRGKKLYSYQ